MKRGSFDENGDEDDIEIPEERRYRDADLAALKTFRARKAEKPPMEEISIRGVTLDETPGIAHAGNALKSGDMAFVLGLLQQLTHIQSAEKHFPIDRMNFAMSIINEIGPKDPTEALLVSQMAAIHCAAMECSRRMAVAPVIQRIDAELRAMTKLTRTFAAQMEALKRYRAPAEKSIRVVHQHQHITVKDGGQAIVGTVQPPASPSLSKSGAQSHGFTPETSPTGELDASGAALLGHVEAVGTALPGASVQGQEGLPLPRRQGRSANGKG